MNLRFLRLATFGLVTLAITLGSLYLLFSLGFIYIATHPLCLPRSVPEGFPAPQEYWIVSHDETHIRIWYYPSQNGAAVIAMGGMDGALGSRLPPVSLLLSAGYGVVQVDSRSCGKPSRIVTLGALEREDALAAVDFLLTQPEVDPQRIGIFGYSMGGAASIRAAAQSSNIRAVVAEGGYYNLGKDIVSAGDGLPVILISLQQSMVFFYNVLTGIDAFSISPVDDISQIKEAAILLIYSESENASGRGTAQFQAANPPKQLWIVVDGAHGNNHVVAPDEYHRRILDFFNRYLLELP
jgi:uncharacterized protein